MQLNLAYSPCPNDCFIFDALVHNKIDTEGLTFNVILADVEELNRKAFAEEIDITKLSYHALAHLTDKYALMNAGSALGNNCGPLLISKNKINAEKINSSEIKIAIPGKYTTANFLLSLAYPNATNKVPVLFSDIENKVLSGEFDAGLIIHENRFTYAERGLQKIADLGEYWETLTQSPIPLGGIVIKRSIPNDIQLKVDRLIRKSVEYAFANPSSSLEYVREHAQEMNEEVMYKHIELYVNSFSIDLGEKGKKAVQLLFETAVKKGIIPHFSKNIFV